MSFKTIIFSLMSLFRIALTVLCKPFLASLYAILLCSCNSSDQIKAYCQYPQSTITYTHQEIYEKAATFIIQEVEAQGSELVLPGNGDIRALTEFLMTNPRCLDCSFRYSAWSDPPTIFVYLIYRKSDVLTPIAKIDDSESVRVRVLITGCGDLREIELPKGE